MKLEDVMRRHRVVFVVVEFKQGAKGLKQGVKGFISNSTVCEKVPFFKLYRFSGYHEGR